VPPPFDGRDRGNRAFGEAIGKFEKRIGHLDQPQSVLFDPRETKKIAGFGRQVSQRHYTQKT
jgi:hypothetical protein